MKIASPTAGVDVQRRAEPKDHDLQLSAGRKRRGRETTRGEEKRAGLCNAKRNTRLAGQEFVKLTNMQSLFAKTLDKSF
jgi:hypothetical protein